MKKIVTDHPIPARCQHFGVCGGCRYQHIPYIEQLKAKEAFVQECFPESTPHPIIASEDPCHYRNKMEFTFRDHEKGEGSLELVIPGNRGCVEDISHCHIAPNWFSEVLQVVRDWWKKSELHAYQQEKNTGSLRTLVLREGRNTGDRLAMLTVSGNADFALNKKQLSTFKQAVQSHVSSLFIRIQQLQEEKETEFFEMHLAGADTIRESICGWMFHISPTGFFRPNTKLAERLYKRAFEMAAVPPNGVIYDLYCGTGIMGICASPHAKQVIGIELSPESALDARENVKRNGIKNVTIHCGCVGEVLEKGDFPPADFVIIDPPSAGLSKHALDQIILLQPKKILAIACNPKTQALNIRYLQEPGGYEFQEVQPLDQCPHTPHIETICILEKRKDLC